MKTRIKTLKEITNIRQSGAILATVLKILEDSVRPGMTTQQVDDIAYTETIKRNGLPAFKGYEGFPAHICISINDEVVHTIPGTRVIKRGDIVGLDYGVEYGGMITDSAITIAVGDATKDAQRLLKGTKQALYRAIDIIRDGVRVGDIGSVIETELKSHNLSIAEGLSGHGVGHQVHEEPSIPNFGTRGTGQVLRAGMTIAVEPIATVGQGKIYLASDGWTYKTVDGSLSAQFEHTILITQHGAEVLTDC